MKHVTFLILKLLIKFLQELVVGQGLFSAKSPCLYSNEGALYVVRRNGYMYMGHITCISS